MTKSLLCIQSARFGLMLLCLLGYSINGISQIDFQEVREIPGPFPDQGHIKSADIDGDGDLDFLVMGQTITNIVVMSTHLYKNDGNGNFTYVENTPFAGAVGGAAVFGDVDSDNDLDVLIVGYETVDGGGTGTGKLYLNDGAGNFTIAPSNPFPAVFASTVKFFDFNGDSHLDLFFTGLLKTTSPPVVAVFVGDGNGNFQEVLDHGLQAFSWPTFNAGDVDGDGDEDIISGGLRGSTKGTFIFYREGNKYVRAQLPFTPYHGGTSELADFDKDGDLDFVIFGKDYDHSAEYWQNDGAGNFSKVDQPFIKIAEHTNLVVQDFDFDDDLDIYLGSSGTYLEGNYIYLNDGNGNFTINNFNFSTALRMGSGAGDFDGKGLVDIIEFRNHDKLGPSRCVIYINNIDLNEPPSVTTGDVSGKLLVGFDISGNYTFMDEDGDEDQSSFQWYRADDALGTNKIQIENAHEKEYSIIELDEGKFLSVEITPFDGIAAGAAIQSPFVGPIEQPQPRLFLSGNSAPILDGILETSQENHTDFGQIEYGGQLSRVYTMKNDGDVDLVISEISISGENSNEFSVQDFLPLTLSVGMQAPLTVYFQASGLGRRSAEIKIAANQQGAPFSFGISGTGLNLPPVFNSIFTIEYSENGTQPVVDVNASNGEDGLDDEHILYTLSGGEDSGLFNINSSGELSFINSPDFENPGDANKDNQYRLEIVADDGELLNHSTVQQISIAVTNLDEFPVANCKADFIVYMDENGVASLNADDLDDGSTDDLEIVGMFTEPSIFHCSDLGEHTVVFTVLDSGGNTDSCETTIRVADNIKPVISPVSVIVTENDPGKCGAIIAISPPLVVDNCEVLTASGQRSDNLPLEAAFPIGNTTITWSAKGAEGVIQVVNVLDADAPVFGTIPTIEASTDIGSSGAILIIPIPEISDCGTVNILGSRSDGLPLQSNFPVGETTIIWTATDGTTTAIPVTQKIMVMDNEPPIIEGPFNLTITSEAGNCGKLLAITPPEVTDNCEGTIQVIGVRDDQRSLEDLFPVGVTKIRWNAVDVHNNPALEVTQTITVEEKGTGEITFTGPEGPREIGVGIPMAASFTDVNIVSATWTALDGNFNVHKSFTEPLSKGIGTSAYTFENLSPGVYTVKLDLKHECGTVSSKIFEYVVIYDPNGGFVTGGGWIISPEGAMKDIGMQMTTGVANFGFNAKYKNGNNEVNEVGGETNFQFKLGNLHFKSSSHQAMSLVVSGGFKATYKGVGALNGEPGYDFMVTVIDAAESESHQTDLFRIKISKGNRVIYDNNVLIDAENADPTTAIDGGSIVIHKPIGTKTKEQVVAQSVEVFHQEALESFSAYPNPMEEMAIIEFSLSTTTTAVLSLYDLNGREVLALFSGKVEGGKIYEIEISNRNLMQGIYIYRLTTESGKAYQKQLMVK